MMLFRSSLFFAAFLVGAVSARADRCLDPVTGHVVPREKRLTVIVSDHGQRHDTDPAFKAHLLHLRLTAPGPVLSLISSDMVAESALSTEYKDHRICDVWISSRELMHRVEEGDTEAFAGLRNHLAQGARVMVVMAEQLKRSVATSNESLALALGQSLNLRQGRMLFVEPRIPVVGDWLPSMAVLAGAYALFDSFGANWATVSAFFAFRYFGESWWKYPMAIRNFNRRAWLARFEESQLVKLSNTSARKMMRKFSSPRCGKHLEEE